MSYMQQRTRAQVYSDELERAIRPKNNEANRQWVGVAVTIAPRHRNTSTVLRAVGTTTERVKLYCRAATGMTFWTDTTYARRVA